MPKVYTPQEINSTKKKTWRTSGKMKSFIRLLRIKQWVKNLFILIPTFFAGRIFVLADVVLLLEGVAAFSLAASGIYILNDYKDREVDRVHPEKKLRPIASGAVNEKTALVFSVILLTIGLGWSMFVNVTFFYILLCYVTLNIAYSLGLKHVAILDLFIVAFGFLLRIYSGGVIADLAITHWLAVMILLLALFLVIAKRRDDLVIRSSTGDLVRKASKSYNLEFINSCLTLLSAVIIVAYIMYTVSPEVVDRFNSSYLFITTVFVIAGIMRYLQITFVEEKSGNPTSILYQDKFILFTILAWIASFYIIIYTS
jgi:decaprenyl-phosphate phosphoribosyltransferase